MLCCVNACNSRPLTATARGFGLAGLSQVITTYDTLASDFAASGGPNAFEEDVNAEAGGKRKRQHGVMSLGWNRVVLDEAHTIRNSKTMKHKVCCCCLPLKFVEDLSVGETHDSGPTAAEPKGGGAKRFDRSINF